MKLSRNPELDAPDSTMRRATELHGTWARVRWTCTRCGWKTTTAEDGSVEDRAAGHVRSGCEEPTCYEKDQ